MNSWKKIVASLCAGVMMTVGPVLPMASGSGTGKNNTAALVEYIRAAWQGEDPAKAQVIATLESENLTVLDLSAMQANVAINLDDVQSLQGLRELVCPRTGMVFPPALPETLERLDFVGGALLRFPIMGVAEKFLHSKQLKVLKLNNGKFFDEAEAPLFISPTVEELDLSGNDLRSLLGPRRGILANGPVLGLLVVSPEARRAMAASFGDLKGRYGQEYIDEISKPLTLKKLILRDCMLGARLTGLPESLEELDLEGSTLPNEAYEAASVDALIQRLPNLRILNLDWSRVEDLLRHNWSDLARAVIAGSVRKLDIGRRHFVGVQDFRLLWGLVAHMTQLEELNIRDPHTVFNNSPARLPANLRKLVFTEEILNGLSYINHFGRVTPQQWVAFFAQVPQLEELDLSCCSLSRALPAGLPANMRKLVLGSKNYLWTDLPLGSNYFREVTAQEWTAFFAQMQQLEELDLRQCFLTALPAGLPASMRKLVLGSNDFAQVTPQEWAMFFAQMQQLEELDLSRCCLTALPGGLPANMRKLVSWENDFTQVTAQEWEMFFAGVPQLEELILEDCCLTALPAGLPANMRKLVFRNKNFIDDTAEEWSAQEWTAFFARVAQLAQLEELDLSQCFLTALPAGLPVNLRKLRLAVSDFSGVTAEEWVAFFERVAQLEELDLADCGLTALPAGLPVNLRKLRLAGNDFSGVTAEEWVAFFERVAQLEELDLIDCILRALPGFLPRSLVWLDLATNNFAGVVQESWRNFFARNVQLERLNLEECELTELPDGLPVNLNMLWLGENDFSNMDGNLFYRRLCQLSQLEILALNDCHLTALPVELPARLRELNLKKNGDFSRFTAEEWTAFFARVAQLEKIYLSGHFVPAGLPARLIVRH